MGKKARPGTAAQQFFFYVLGRAATPKKAEPPGSPGGWKNCAYSVALLFPFLHKEDCRLHLTRDSSKVKVIITHLAILAMSHNKYYVTLLTLFCYLLLAYRSDSALAR